MASRTKPQARKGGVLTNYYYENTVQNLRFNDRSGLKIS